MANCRNCQKELSRDEVGIYKRLVDRSASDGDCLCKECLARGLGVTAEVIDEKIAHFKEIGCTLLS